MRSEIKIYPRSGGEIQRVQLVYLEDWSKLNFLEPQSSQRALDCFAQIYRNHLVPACPWLFGNMVLFRLPEDIPVSLPESSRKYGVVADRLTAAAAVLEEGISVSGGKPKFHSSEAERLWNALEAGGCIRIVRGKLPITTIIPVGNQAGFLTETDPEAAMKVNSHFFIMDRFDCATAYDHLGTPFGLCVKDGKVLHLPLYGREALLVNKDGSARVEALDVRNRELKIRGKVYRHGHNAEIYTRPERLRTPSQPGTDLVIVGCRVAAVRNGGSTPIPASGFVLRVAEEGICPGDPVEICGFEDVVFGVQVGNSVLIDGKKTDTFRSRFYNIRHLQPVPYPPSLYSMNFRKARAARIALGANKEGKPMLLWAEGAGKRGYLAGQESCGASLSEMADICADVGMVNAVNLDGGGSAQILLKNCRSLLISDRKGREETERPVPLGLIIR